MLEIVGLADIAISGGVPADCRRKLTIAGRVSSLSSRYVVVSRIYINVMRAAHGMNINVARKLECLGSGQPPPKSARVALPYQKALQATGRVELMHSTYEA